MVEEESEVKAKENQMATPVDIVRSFYSAIAAGDTGKMVELMTSDIEWISVVNFNVQEKGPAEVMKKVFAPLMQEWESFSPAPSEFLVDGSTVVSLGRFACVHSATHKRADLSIRPCVGCSGRKDLASPSISRHVGARRSSARLGLTAQTHRRRPRRHRRTQFHSLKLVKLDRLLSSVLGLEAFDS